MKQWYDGYTVGNAGSIYNPNSVMKALRSREYDSYWTEASAAKSLMEYISLDFDDMSKTLAELLGGIEVSVDTKGFANDLVTFIKSPMPAMVIELKWNQSARGAIAQIKEKRYPEALSGYGGEILLVGIAYDKDAGEDKRKHTCVIEKT